MPSAGALSPRAIVAGDLVPTGGMDMPNLALASYWARQGRPVTVVAHSVAPLLAKLPSIDFRRVPKPAGSYLLGAPLLDRAGRRAAAEVLSAGGRVLVNGGNCRVGDVNWVHYVHAAFLARQRGWRVAKQLLERPLDLMAERRALHEARLVIANSERTRRDLLTLLGLSDDKVRVVYYGIDGATFRPASDDERAQVRAELELGHEPAIGFVGALGDSRKGFDTLFEAWALLARRGVDARLVVLGRGGALSHWQKRARDAGLSRSLRFLGFRSDVGRVLGALDGVVAPTRYEAFGQAVHEALCCGLPAVVSARAGVAERISPALCGLLLGDEQSPGELADKLDLLLAELGSFRDEARRLAEVLRPRSWDTMAAEISAAMEG